jgi:predicted DNA-binding transcriptional regulator AlpA
MTLKLAPEAADVLLAAREVAPQLGVSEGNLAQWRYNGTGPKFVKLGRLVRYRQSDVQAFIDANTRSNTAGDR